MHCVTFHVGVPSFQELLVYCLNVGNVLHCVVESRGDVFISVLPSAGVGKQNDIVHGFG